MSRNCTLLITLILLLPAYSFSQTVTPSIQNVTGGSAKDGYYHFDWSVGKLCVIESYFKPFLFVTNGFLQPHTEKVNIPSTSLGSADILCFPIPRMNRPRSTFSLLSADNNEKHDESVATQIRKGTAANMRFMPVPAGTTEPVNTQKAIAARTVSLPSEQPMRVEPAAKMVAPVLPAQQVADESPARKKE